MRKQLKDYTSIATASNTNTIILTDTYRNITVGDLKSFMISDLQTSVASATNSIEVNINSTTTSILSITTSLVGLYSDLSSATYSIYNLQSGLVNTNTLLNTATASILSKIDLINTNVNSATTSILTLSNQINGLTSSSTASIDEIKQNILSATTSIGVIQADIVNIFGAFDAQYTLNENTNVNILSATTSILSVQNNLHSATVSIQSDLSSIFGAINDHQIGIELINTNVNSATTSILSVQNNLHSATTSLANDVVKYFVMSELQVYHQHYNVGQSPLFEIEDRKALVQITKDWDVSDSLQVGEIYEFPMVLGLDPYETPSKAVTIVASVTTSGTASPKIMFMGITRQESATTYIGLYNYGSVDVDNGTTSFYFTYNIL